MLEISVAGTFGDADQQVYQPCSLSSQDVSTYSGRLAAVVEVQCFLLTQSNTFVVCSYSIACTFENLSEKKVEVIQLQGFFSKGDGQGAHRSRIPDCKNCDSFLNNGALKNTSDSATDKAVNANLTLLWDHCFYMQGCTDCFRAGDESVVEAPPPLPKVDLIVVVQA